MLTPKQQELIDHIPRMMGQAGKDLKEVLEEINARFEALEKAGDEKEEE